MAEFNNLTADLGQHALPAVNTALRDLKGIIEGIRSVLPGASKDDKSKSESNIGARVIEGAVGFGLVGSVVTGIGTVGGAIGGGILGGVEQYMKNEAEKDKKLSQDQQLLKAQALAGGVVQPIAFSLNADGKTLAQALINIGAASFDGQAPAFNGLTSFSNGDSQHTDK
jgi:hypothetical protein